MKLQNVNEGGSSEIQIPSLCLSEKVSVSTESTGHAALGRQGGEGGRILEHEETTLGNQLDYKVHTTQCSDVIPPRFNATHGWIFFLVYKALSVKSLF